MQGQKPHAGIVVTVVSPRILASTISGHFDAALAQQLVTHLDSWVRMGGDRLIAFHDCDEITDYDSEGRLIVTRWSRAHVAKFLAVHLLVRSRTVAWGLKILNSLLGDVMIAHSARDSFDRARAEASK